MKMIPYDVKKLKRGYKLYRNQEIIMEFAESEYECVKIEEYQQKCVRYAQSNLSTSIKRMGIRNIKAITRGGELFLVKIKA